jgi:hypothetical protein
VVVVERRKRLSREIGFMVLGRRGPQESSSGLALGASMSRMETWEGELGKEKGA